MNQPTHPRSPLLEISVGNTFDAVAAAVAGADRIELCSALCLGGLTPSAGTISSVVAAIDVPVMVMIRPREGGFCFRDDEFKSMLLDARMVHQLAADGMVCGALRADSTIDMPRCREMIDIAQDKQTVFHRAFDLVPDPYEALEQLIELGFTRVLTSGQAATAVEGAQTIAELVTQAAGRIEILPGGGLNDSNVLSFLHQTGCRQVHMGLSDIAVDHSMPKDHPVCFNSPVPHEREHRTVDQGAIARVRELLRSQQIRPFDRS